MKVGVTLFAQNYTDWDRFEQMEADPTAAPPPPSIHDAQIYREQLHLGRQVEPMGFDSLWTVEHHFTPYTMITNPSQFLAYFAGITKKIDMGTMITVLPWHDPVRVAEGYIALDHMLDGRNLKVGFGRGLGKREYDGMRVPMDESRERFSEGLAVFRKAIEKEWFSHEGDFNMVPRTTMRPQPRPGNTLLDNIYIAWGSPTSVPVAAKENAKPLFIPQRGWDEHRDELLEYNRLRIEAGWEPERPTAVCWVYCAETDDEAMQGAAQYMSEYGDSAQRHYQMMGEHLQGLKGYEYYAQMAKQMEEMADQMPEGMDANSVYLQNHVWGSPETCIEKMKVINDKMGADDFVAVFSYGGMPVDKAEKSMKLFSEKVLPAVQAFELSDMDVLVTA